jgi:hypothetical protein
MIAPAPGRSGRPFNGPAAAGHAARRLVTAGLVAVLTTGLAVAAAGCSSGSAPGQRASGTPAGSSPRTASGDRPGIPDSVAVIESVRIRPADAGADAEVALASAEVTAAGPPSLDLCFGRFDSESHRVARRLYTVLATEGDQAARNDVVVYDSPDSARQALAEARQVTASCPPGVARQSSVSDQPPTAFRYTPLPAAQLHGLAPGALAVTETASAAGAQPRRATRIVQQQGPVLVIVDGYTSRGAALALARSCARRLAALPPQAR